MSVDPTGLLSGAFGLAGTLINVDAQESANRANLQVARENRDFYYQQWLRENAYNSPSAQMQRLSVAGLNPSLMYGEGAGGLPASASMANVENGRVVAPQVDPYLLAQIANINADTEKKKVEAKATSDENARQNELQPFNVQNLQHNNDVLAQTVKTMSAQEQEAYARAALADVDGSIKNSTAAVLLDGMKADARMKNSVADFNLEQTKQLVAFYQLKKQGIVLSNQEIISRIGINEAEFSRLEKALSLMDSEIELNKATAESTPMNALANYTGSKASSKQADTAASRTSYQNELDKASAEFQRANASYLRSQEKYPGIFGQALRSIYSFGKDVTRTGWNFGKKLSPW